MATPSQSGIIQVGEERWIPASKRADGSIRKEKKIRPGFVPLEDVARYVNPRSKPATSSSNQNSTQGASTKTTTAAAGKNDDAKNESERTVEEKDDIPTEKRIRALQKTLRQIKVLEDKLIKGEELKTEQYKKVQKGKSVRDMLEQLEKLSISSNKES